MDPTDRAIKGFYCIDKDSEKLAYQYFDVKYESCCTQDL